MKYIDARTQNSLKLGVMKFFESFLISEIRQILYPFMKIQKRNRGNGLEIFFQIAM